MEKAILKTLKYEDFSEYPMKAYEIHKWLISKKATLFQVEIALSKLLEKRKIESLDDYYFLPKKGNLITEREQKDKQFSLYLRKVKLLSFFLKIIPDVKLVGISKNNNINLTIIIDKKSRQLLRILTILILNFLVMDIKENGELEKPLRKNLQNALKILQMRLVWQRDKVYAEYLMENQWAFKFLPNWIAAD